MISTIIGALLPTAVTLLLGLVAGWHHDFDIKKATVLNSMVMLYALPLSLFAGMVGMSRDQVLSQGPLAFAIVLGMAGGYAIVFFISHYLFRRDLVTASLQALAIAGPAVPFIGASILGHLFGASSAVPISVAGLVMNLIQVPATLMLASAGVAQKDSALTAKPPSLGGHIVHALRQPVVWTPLLALVLILCNLPFPRVAGRFARTARERDRRRRPICLGHRAVFVPSRFQPHCRRRRHRSEYRHTSRDMGTDAPSPHGEGDHARGGAHARHPDGLDPRHPRRPV